MSVTDKQPRPGDIVTSILTCGPDAVMLSQGYSRTKWIYLRGNSHGVVHSVEVDISPRSAPNVVRFCFLPAVRVKQLAPDGVAASKYPVCLNARFVDYCSWSVQIPPDSQTLACVAGEASEFLSNKLHPLSGISTIEDIILNTMGKHPAIVEVHIKLLLLQNRRQEALRHFTEILKQTSFTEWIVELKRIGRLLQGG